VIEVLVLATLLGASFAVALAGSSGLLALVLHLMMRRQFPVRIHWRPIAFFGTLFWCWYLAPGVAESALFAHVISLLTP